MAETNEDQPTEGTIWEALDEWGAGLAAWQRYILTNAVREGELSAEKIGIAYHLFLEKLGLANALENPTEIPASITGRIEQGGAPPLQLVSLSNLTNVNAIPSASGLTFGEGLTIVYGGTGAGKTGFVRILSSACFSRSKPEILPNIYANGPHGDPVADIVVKEGNQGEETVNFTPDIEHVGLRRVSVFDSHVARIHLTEENPLGFQPAGFDVFPEMTRVISELGQRLDTDIEARDRENTFTNSFLDDSPIKETIEALGPITDIEALGAKAVFGPEEQARATEVDRQLRDLQKKSPEEALKSLNQAKGDIKALQECTNAYFEALDLKACEGYQHQLDDLRGKSAAAIAAGTEAFGGGGLKETGSPDWVTFIKAAKTLADDEKEDYPDPGDPCLLCHRPLDEPSATLIKRFWGFLDDEAQTTADAANAVLDGIVNSLKALNLDLLPEESRVRTHIERLSPELANKLYQLSASLTARRDVIINVLETVRGELPTDEIIDPRDDVAALVTQIEADEARLKKGNAGEAIKALQQEHILLRHRQVLSQLIADITAFVDDKKWVTLAQLQRRRALNTRFVTDKERDLFRALIEGHYRNRLRQECERLDCNLPIEFQARGRGGQTVHSLAIQGGHNPPDILSEGEQRAVALSDFLTEVNINPGSAGIVLDDPVTSLDHQRKRLISHRLVDEAKNRQVIVFTHDITFLSSLLEDAQDEGVDLTTHWVERDADDIPGQVTLNDSPANTDAYKTTQKARQTLAEARNLSGQQRVDAIRRGMAELRRTLEEVVIRHLFKGVVKRWEEQIWVSSVKKIMWSDELADEIPAINEELANYIEGHSHSDERAGHPPDLPTFEGLINRVDAVHELARRERPQG